MTQGDFLDQVPEQSSKPINTLPVDRFKAAMMFSAIGDALGWPTEFLDPHWTRKAQFDLPLYEFIRWQKLVGGKWWGYEDIITPGQYSDDTQLALAVARCIDDTGVFEPERFAYEELPLWLQYERGGGRSVKTAAKRLISKKADWLQNFYKQGQLDYRNAGANGAAMRNLPVSLANAGNEPRIITDSIINSIITHGHPRAILGAILFALAVNYALSTSSQVSAIPLVEYLRTWMDDIEKYTEHDGRIMKWIRKWESYDHKSKLSFHFSLNNTRQEASSYLSAIPEFLGSKAHNYYDFVGALNPATKGSGLATVCAAIYLFLKGIDQPEKAMVTAVNTLGSDTDTIAAFLGAMLGAHYGLAVIPTHLVSEVQDVDYLIKTATRMHSIATKEQQEQSSVNQKVARTDAYVRILAWEIGLHEMFWDAIDKGGKVIHPTIGRGTIIDKVEKPIRREDYIAKLIRIDFDCGQTCTFHSLVQNNNRVSESLAEDIGKALNV